MQKKYIFLGVITLFSIWWIAQTPSLSRDWIETDNILPEITFSGDIIDIKNVRNFEHISETESIPGYYDESYDIAKLNSLYYIIEPFSDYDGPAHTMLSFGFSDGKYVTISAELRKEQGEYFNPILGALNQYELMYIIGDENDLVKLRANIRKDIVRMYPMKATEDQMQYLFTSMVIRADKLTKQPEFYNTLYKSCTTSILSHVNQLRTEKLSALDFKVLLPSNSDMIAYEEDLIDTSLTLEEAREYYEINELSEKFGESEDYSKEIRKERK